MELKIPIEIVFDDVNSVIDELGKLQKYKLGEGDDMTLVDVDDVADVLTRHVMAREAQPEIIRCKDCKYAKWDDEREDYICNGRAVWKNHYCGYAKRKGEIE